MPGADKWQPREALYLLGIGCLDVHLSGGIGGVERAVLHAKGTGATAHRQAVELLVRRKADAKVAAVTAAGVGVVRFHVHVATLARRPCMAKPTPAPARNVEPVKARGWRAKRTTFNFPEYLL